MRNILAFFGVLSILLTAVPPDVSGAVLPFKVGASVQTGYDNNPSLDSSRDEDFFIQEALAVKFRNLLRENLQWRASADLINVNYFDMEQEDVFRPAIGTGFDWKVGPDTYLEADVDLTYVAFPNDDDVTSLNQDGRIGIVQRLTKDVSVRMGASIGQRDFEEGKAALASGLDSTEERQDERWSIDNGVDIRVHSKAMLRLGHLYLENDSNDAFFDYYDYELSRWFASVTVLPARNWRLQGRLAYENREYESRPTFAGTDTETDDIYSASASALYRLPCGVSVGYTISYRQKDSNEPAQEYSGMVNTLGLFFSF